MRSGCRGTEEVGITCVVETTGNGARVRTRVQREPKGRCCYRRPARRSRAFVEFAAAMAVEYRLNQIKSGPHPRTRSLPESPASRRKWVFRRKNAAPTAAAPSALAWPCKVPLLVAKLLMVLPAPSSSTTTLILPGIVPLTRPTSMFKVSGAAIAGGIGWIIDDHDLIRIGAQCTAAAAGSGHQIAIVDFVHYRSRR